MKGSTHDNDNDDTWQTLSAATERALGKPGFQNGTSSPEKHSDKADEDGESDKNDRVAEGIRNIERFEARYRRGR